MSKYSWQLSVQKLNEIPSFWKDSSQGMTQNEKSSRPIINPCGALDGKGVTWDES